MEILGRIRNALARLDLRAGEKRIYALMVNAVVHPHLARAQGVQDGFDDEENARRPIYDMFRETGSIRAFSRFDIGKRDGHKYQNRRFDFWKDHAVRLVDVGLPPVHALWYHWILLAGERFLHIPADRDLLKRLWFRGFYEQRPDGRLLWWDPDESIDAMVYDELTALHAAYNAAKIFAGPDAPAMMDQVRRAIRWHVENTQPDNTTNEPWALAAFVALDDTHTFAEQQLHDTLTWLQNAPPLLDGKVPVAIGLLADAVMTLENW